MNLEVAYAKKGFYREMGQLPIEKVNLNSKEQLYLGRLERQISAA
jgi:hypothetical protein